MMRLTIFLHLPLFAATGFLAACSPGQDTPGLSITEISNPAAQGGRYPYIVASGGKTLMSWQEPAAGLDDEVMNLVWASFDGAGWSQPELIQSSNSFFVNWADFPSLTAGGDAPMAAHWLQKTEGGVYAYHVEVAFRSKTGDWSQPYVPHRDRSPKEHGFASMLPLDDERALAIWLDGYQSKGMEHIEAGHDGDPGTNLDTAMTLHSAILGEGGAQAGEFEIDASVCDCCQTSLARSGNNIVAVYRNRDEEEVRDHYRAVFNLETETWSAPAALSNDGWKIPGCPVNGPQVDALNETVIATWFSAANDHPTVSMAVSNDNGLTFDAPVRLADGETLGRADVAFNPSGQALLTWIRLAGEEAMVIGKLWREGSLSDEFEIGPIDATRASGFPRSAAVGNNFLVAWTEPGSGSNIISLLVAPPGD